MEKKKFNANTFLNVNILSPLQSLTIKGGLADKIITHTLSSVVVNIANKF
jgi:hypothetical protein